ncbi:MAG: MFS transporter [Desulfobacterales bacterium]|nr:MFS transporter [Desulfobacterales bacterium]
MKTKTTPKRLSGWYRSLKAFGHPRVATMLFFGFSAGVPILLIFSSLSLWLREAGVERSAVTFFSWAALGYSFKFVWAPLVDQMPVPFLTKVFGRRRGWILTAQAGIITAILWMAMTDPASGQNQLVVMAMAAVLLGFSSATQDIVIDAYRIESAGEELQAMMASAYIAGYRIGMLAAGAGALFLADIFGSSKGAYNYGAWQTTYWIMAGVMAVGVATALIIKEPEVEGEISRDYGTTAYLRSFLLFVVAAAGFVLWFSLTAVPAAEVKAMLGDWVANRHLAGFAVAALRLGGGIGTAVGIARLLTVLGVVDREMVRASYVEPVSDFFNRYGGSLAWLLLALIGLYRISDIVLGVISNVFYQDLGFSKTQIAGVVKTFGLLMTIAGGFLGGILSLKYGVIRILFAGALLSSLTNVLFVVMAETGPSLPMLYLVISADNLAAGLASAAFVAFLSSLTSIRFTAMQYAVFSSLMTLIPKGFSGYSGSIVDALGYPAFFMITAVMGLPVLVLVRLCGRHLKPGPEDQ